MEPPAGSLKRTRGAGAPKQLKEEAVSGSFSSWRFRIGERKVRKDCALLSLNNNNNDRGRGKVASTFTEVLLCTGHWVLQTFSYLNYKIPQRFAQVLFQMPSFPFPLQHHLLGRRTSMDRAGRVPLAWGFLWGPTSGRPQEEGGGREEGETRASLFPSPCPAELSVALDLSYPSLKVSDTIVLSPLDSTTL